MPAKNSVNSQNEYLRSMHRQAAAIDESSGSGLKTIKFKDGDKKTVRLIGGDAPEHGVEWGNPNSNWFCSDGVHWMRRPGEQKDTPVACVKHVGDPATGLARNERCVFCDMSYAVYKAMQDCNDREAIVLGKNRFNKKEKLKELHRMLGVSRRYLIPCVVKFPKDQDDVVQILDVSSNVIGQINNNLEFDNDAGIAPQDLFHPGRGIALLIRREGAKLDTKYHVTPGKPMPLHSSGQKDACVELIRSVPPFSELLRGVDQDIIDEFAQIMQDRLTRCGVEFDGDVGASRSRSKPGAKKSAPKAAPAEDEWDEESSAEPAAEEVEETVDEGDDGFSGPVEETDADSEPDEEDPGAGADDPWGASADGSDDGSDDAPADIAGDGEESADGDEWGGEATADASEDPWDAPEEKAAPASRKAAPQKTAPKKAAPAPAAKSKAAPAAKKASRVDADFGDFMDGDPAPSAGTTAKKGAPGKQAGRPGSAKGATGRRK